MDKDGWHTQLGTHWVPSGLARIHSVSYYMYDPHAVFVLDS